MRGFPRNPVPCTVCGAPGYPKNQRCLKHWPPTARLKYPFDAAKDAILRAAWRNAGDKYKLTAAISDATRRIGYPRYILLLRAQRMGLTFDTRHKWEKWEEEYLLQNAGVLSIKSMQRKLGHGWSAIASKIDSMGLRYGIKEGMSAADLATGFGVAHQTVKKWEDIGIIKRGGKGHPNPDRFSDATVRAFAAKYPDMYDLRRVDQEWYKALLFPQASCFLPRLGKDDTVRPSRTQSEFVQEELVA